MVAPRCAEVRRRGFFFWQPSRLGATWTDRFRDEPLLIACPDARRPTPASRGGLILAELRVLDICSVTPTEETEKSRTPGHDGQAQQPVSRERLTESIKGWHHEKPPFLPELRGDGRPIPP